MARDQQHSDRLRDAFADLVSTLSDAGLAADQRADIDSFGAALAQHLHREDLLLARYEFLFEAAPDPYVVTDDAGVITEANEAGRALLGLDDAIEPGVELETFIAPDERDRYRGWLAQLRSGVPQARWDTHLQLHDDARPVPVEISLADDLEGIGFRWALRDQRERAAAEHQLRSVAEREHRVAGELRAEARINSRFLVSLSHDLRGPIGALLHQAELLMTDDLAPEVRLRSRSAMEDNAQLLAHLLEALVDVERYALGEFELRRTATPVVDLVESLRRGNGDDTVIVGHVDPSLRADINVDTIRRALLTTVNALVDTDGGRVTISVSEVTDMIQIDVVAATDRFSVSHERVDMRLARALVEMHGGTLRHERTSQTQSVTLTLPVGRTDVPS